MISGVRQEDYYKTIQYIHISEGHPIEKLCRKLNVNRSAYYKWLKRTPSSRQIENEQICRMDQDAVLRARRDTRISADDDHSQSGVQCSLQQETNPETNADTPFEVGVQKETV